ncbi:MAG: hypothetical protein SF097_15510 [Acidobacteriota bacterium]|nr:hypothetical protein [Acidobacteriota bacterium]
MILSNSRFSKVVLISLLATLLALNGACRQSVQPSSSPLPQSKPAVSGKDAGIRSDIGFATRRKFLDHYEKHGNEFGSISQEEYLRRAQSLRDRAMGGDILEAARADGVITRFDRQTGAFLAFNADLTIRTYFKPNDGEAYFKRQSKRGSTRQAKGDDNE